uniref:PHD domain-containing protein n=1 Tax=Caenorhabditis tropicalis TaxID=1561998 RepID=A0A1I7TRK6_9PELO
MAKGSKNTNEGSKKTVAGSKKAVAGSKKPAKTVKKETKKAPPPIPSRQAQPKESWFCPICKKHIKTWACMCPICKDWYHFKCVNMRPDDYPGYRYRCPSCAK